MTKNVILITIDCLRKDHLKSYGYFRNTAPNTENFFNDGFKFMNHYPNGSESPSSFSSLFTSELPYENGEFSPLPNSKKMVNEIIKKYSIKTIGIHSNPNTSPYFNYNRSWNIFDDGTKLKLIGDHFKDLGKKKIKTSTKLLSLLKKKLTPLLNTIILNLKGLDRIKKIFRKYPFLSKILIPIFPVGYNAPYIVDKVIKYINSVKGNKFVWLHFMDVHSPYLPPREMIHKFLKIDISHKIKKKINGYGNKPDFVPKDEITIMKALYDVEIFYVDFYLKKLYEFIESTMENYMIILTSDHGDSFYEKGYLKHCGHIYQQLLNIPLYIKHSNIHNSKRVYKITQHIDIAPTILSYFNIKKPTQYKGINLLDIKNIPQKRLVFTETYQKNCRIKRNKKEGYRLMSIIDNQWKYIFDEENNNKEYLFNIENDPKEYNNLINNNQSKLNELRMIKHFHLEKANEMDKLNTIIKKMKL